MPTIHGYIRASTSGQQYTYEAQTRAMKPHFQAWRDNGGSLGRIYKDEAVSGGTEIFDRPAGRQLWAVLEPGDKIVFAKLDRGFRNFLDYAKFAEMMNQRGVSYISCDLGLDSSTTTGQFVYSVMAAFAQLEREFISQRTKEGLAMRKLRQIPSKHKAPPGWRKLPNDEWDADYTERRVIDWMERQWKRGLSYRQIAAQLKEWDFRRACGTSYGREFVQICIWAKSLGYPGESGWRERWIQDKAKEIISQ